MTCWDSSIWIASRSSLRYPSCLRIGDIRMRWVAPALAAVVLIGAQTTRAAEPSTKPAQEPSAAPVITDAALDAALDSTRNAVQGPAFDSAIRSVAPRFALLTVSTEPGQAIW